MKKKLFLLLFGVFIVSGLSGCAKSAPTFHNNKYYLKHKKTALKVYKWCNKNYPGWRQELPINQSKKWINCANAGSVVVYGN